MALRKLIKANQGDPYGLRTVNQWCHLLSCTIICYSLPSCPRPPHHHHHFSSPQEKTPLTFSLPFLHNELASARPPRVENSPTARRSAPEHNHKSCQRRNAIITSWTVDQVALRPLEATVSSTPLASFFPFQTHDTIASAPTNTVPSVMARYTCSSIFFWASIKPPLPQDVESLHTHHTGLLPVPWSTWLG